MCFLCQVSHLAESYQCNPFSCATRCDLVFMFMWSRFNLACSSSPARVSDKRLNHSIKLLELCKDAVTINIYSLPVIELVKTMCCLTGPVHFSHPRDAWWTLKSVFGVHMMSAVTLPNGSALEVFTGRDLRSSPSSVQNRRAEVGSALTRKNNESPIKFMHAGEA